MATQNRPNILTKTYDQGGSVAAGTSEYVEIYAPSGAVWNVAQLQFQVAADADATGNDHRLVVRTAGDVIALEGVSTYTDKIRFEMGNFQTATERQRPSSDAAQQAQMESMKATEDSPVKIQYKNNMDAAQENTRKIRLLVEEVTY